MKSAVPPVVEWPIAELPIVNASSCFALLDDAYSTPAISRLYSDLSEVLLCADAHGWPELFRATQAALESGLHAVALLSYETGAQLQAIAENLKRQQQELEERRKTQEQAAAPE